MILENQIPLHNLFEKIRYSLPAEVSIYLVGGAVRDLLLGRTTYDLDFVVSEGALDAGRCVADNLGGAFYPLDKERDTARVILFNPDGSRTILDFAGMRAPDLESDLRARDFTINAIGVSLNEPETLIDPLGGVKDLREGVLKACSDRTFIDDPVRILRAIRQSIALDFMIVPHTIQLMRKSANLLARVSAERIRDELYRMLGGKHPATGVRVMEYLGVLHYVLPELSALKGVEQSPPHQDDVWTHTLAVASSIERVLNTLARQHDPEDSASWALGFISVRLGIFRQEIQDLLDESFSPGRQLRAHLYLAGLYHDVGKPQTAQVDENGRIRFFNHEIVGAEAMGERGRKLRLSNEETAFLSKIVRHHMRPLSLTLSGKPLSRRAIYRFFRDTDSAGIAICILSLADSLATYGPELPRELWADQLAVVRDLMEAWWKKQEQEINPPQLVDGGDLMQQFDITPGPIVGALLAAIREAQAAGEVSSREQALELARIWLATQNNNNEQEH